MNLCISLSFCAKWPILLNTFNLIISFKYLVHRAFVPSHTTSSPTYDYRTSLGFLQPIWMLLSYQRKSNMIKKQSMKRVISSYSYLPISGNVLHGKEVFIQLLSNARGPFNQHDLTSTTAWISYHPYCKVWDEITYPFPNFNGAFYPTLYCECG